MDYPRLLKMLRWPVAFLLLTCMASASWAQDQSTWAGERAKLKMTLEEIGPDALARDAGATDRAVSPMNLAQLQVYTYNMGIQLGRIFSSGRGTYPNPDGRLRAYWFTSSVAFAVEGGPWHATGMVHETSDFHSLSKMDWEAKDGARGIQFSNPPILTGGYPTYAMSDLPATWPTSGWPAPESVIAIWAGTDTWNKWKRVGDRNSYCVFDDKYADREGDGQSISLGIEVKKRAVAYGAMNIVYIQYEFTNTSPNNYTGVYVGHVADKGSPSTNDFGNAWLEFDETNQMIYSVAGNYDAATGTHTRSTGERLAFVGQMVMESPTGSFREFPYDANNPGDNIVATSVNPMPLEEAGMTFGPDNILTRVALLDWGDRVLQDEAGLYGALSGDITVMESGHAENVWKTGLSGTGLPILKQDSDDYKAYNSSWDSSVDHFYYTSSGPFSMASGSSFDFVVAFVGGQTLPALMDGAALSKHTYNIKLKGPAAPPAPLAFKANGISAGPGGREYDPRIHTYPIYYAPSGNITLSWDYTLSLTTEDPSSLVNDFEGIRLYRSMDRGATWGEAISDHLGAFAEWLPYRQWDLNNGVKGEDGLSHTHLGTNTGLEDTWTDPNMMDGIEYWYAVTAYDRGEYAGTVQLLRSLESPKGSNPGSPNVIAVIAGSRPSGYQGGEVDGGLTSSLDPVTAQRPGYETGGAVSANVLSDVDVVAGTYRISFSDTAFFGEKPVGTERVDNVLSNTIGVTLERIAPASAAGILYTSLLPDSDNSLYQGDLLPTVDGIKVEVETLWNTGDAGKVSLTYPDYYSPRSNYTSLGNQGYYGSSIDRTIENFANVFFTAEIRWDTTATQMAYVMVRGTSGTGNYLGYNSFPGTVWDVSSVPERQVNIMYSMETGDVTNGLDFDIGYPWYSTNVRHYMRILQSDYSGATPDTVYTGTGSMSGFRNIPDGIWLFVPALTDTVDSGATAYVRDLHGSTSIYKMSGRPINPTLQYEFTATAPTLTDSLVTLDDIKVVPNPYYIYADWDMSNNRRKIQFTNVPMNSEIQIYTLSGELVAILDHHGDATAVAGGRQYNSNRVGTVDWNIWTYEFTEAAYGLYVYIVKTDDGKTKVGKFAIIR